MVGKATNRSRSRKQKRSAPVADTIREFLVGLGFSVNESQQRNFVGALESATLKANLLATAIEDMARTVVGKVSAVAETFEQLYYQSQRIGTSATSIRAFEYAVSQLGGSVDSASASLKSFGDFISSRPAVTESLARTLGIPLKDTADKVQFFLEVTEKLTQRPAWNAKQFVEAYHLGDPSSTFSDILDRNVAHERALKELNFYNEQKKRDAAAGITDDTTKAAAEFEQAWRGVWARIGTMAEGGDSKLMAALTNPMQKFGEWLDNNSDKINDAIGKMATAVGALTTAWVDDLNKVKWPEVATDIDNAAKSIAHFVGELTGMVRWLVDFNEQSKQWWFIKALGYASGGMGYAAGGMTPGGIYDPQLDPDNPASQGGGVGGMLKRAWGGVKSFFGGGGGGNKGVGGWWTPERMKYAADRLVSESGLSQVGAAGLVARWAAVEAPGGPASSNNIGGGHWGIGQWSAARGGPAIGSASFEDQVSHAIGELKTTEARAAAQLRSAKTEGEAAVGASMFERAENYNPVTGVDDQTANTPVGKVLKALGVGTASNSEFRKKLDSGVYDAPGFGVNKSAPPLAWDTASPVWDQFNRSLPVGPVSTDNSSKNVSSTVNNSITVTAPDPQSAAAMVGLHLDRTSNDISRNLQGAFQ
jgi:tail lysozyme